MLSTAPNLTTVIMTSGNFNEGSYFVLMCMVIGDERLAVSNRTFRWYRVNSMAVLPEGANLTFDHLSPQDEGDYRCNSTIISPYLTDSLTLVSQPKTIILKGTFARCVCVCVCVRAVI